MYSTDMSTSYKDMTLILFDLIYTGIKVLITFLSLYRYLFSIILSTSWKICVWTWQTWTPLTYWLPTRRTYWGTWTWQTGNPSTWSQCHPRLLQRTRRPYLWIPQLVSFLNSRVCEKPSWVQVILYWKIFVFALEKRSIHKVTILSLLI